VLTLNRDQQEVIVLVIVLVLDLDQQLLDQLGLQHLDLPLQDLVVAVVLEDLTMLALALDRLTIIRLEVVAEVIHLEETIKSRLKIKIQL